MPYRNNPSVLIRLIVFITLAAVFVSGCKQQTTAGKSFRFPLTAEPRQLDPQVCTDAASVAVISSLFQGLSGIDKGGNAVPAAAEWSVSEDRLCYTFTLYNNVWSDNTPVTAHDYVFGIQRTVMPSTRSDLAKQLYNIKNARQINQGSEDISKLGVSVLDDKRFTVTLARPDGEFIKKTASVPFMPCKQSFFESTGGRYGMETEYTLTNGAFYLKSWSHGEYVLLNKHEGFKDAQNVMPASIRYIIGNVGDTVELLSEGLLDAAPFESERLEDVKDAGLKIIEHCDTVRMLWLNNDIEVLSNAKIRRALRDAIEWDVLYKQFDSISDKPAEGFLPPDAVIGNRRYRTPENKLSPKALGYTASDGLTDGLSEAGVDKMPSLTILCADDEYSARLARYIAQSWQKNLSLYFGIEQLPASEIGSRVSVGNYQIAIYDFAAKSEKAIDILKCFSENAVGNYSHFSDDVFDEKLNAEKGTLTRGQLEQSESMLWQACPSVPLSFGRSYYGINKNAEGINARPFGGGVCGAVYDFFGACKE